MLRQITTIADRQDMPISSISAYAVLGQPHGLIAINWAAWSQSAPDDQPVGVTALDWQRAAETTLPLQIAPDTEAQILASAWALGAWDVTRTVLPANVEGALPPVLGGLADLARRHGLVSWSYRPMLGGPVMRIKAWARRDTTLTPILAARAGDMPLIAIPPIQPGRQVTIRLGREDTAQAQPRPPRRATGRQRAAIVAMRRRLGEGGQPLPAALTVAEASTIISDLMSRLGR
ncbi:hypothetical protein ACEYYA_01045 [Paracoccus sp. p3-h83]